MKKIFSFSTRFFSVMIILLFTATLHAQIKGNGILEEQNRGLSGFNAITSTGPVDVFVKQGNTFSVVVRADGNVINYIKTEIKNNTLVVSVTRNIWRAKTLQVHVTMKNLQKVVLSGSGDFFCKTPFTTHNLQFILTGSGDAKASLNTKNAQVKVAGSGNVEISGIRGDLTIEVNGSGDVEASGLQLENCNLKSVGSGDVELKGHAVTFTAVSAGSGDTEAGGLTAVNVSVKNMGSGDVQVHATDRLEATLAGSGDLYYSGNPPVLKVRTIGSGDVYHK